MICELLLASVLAADVHVLPLERPAESGRLVEFDSRTLVIESDGKRTSYDVAELISVSTPDVTAATSPPSVYVWLIDGTELACDSYAVEGGKAKIALRGGDETKTVEVPTSSIVGVRLRPPEASLAEQWNAIAEAEATGDRIVIRRTNTIDGVEVPSLDTLEGVIYDITDAIVNFKYDTTSIAVKREKLEGIYYFHAAAGRPEDPMCRVTDAAGSRWNVRSMALDGDSLKLVSTTGVETTLPLDRLMKLDFSIGKILYLSDAVPESSEWTPVIGPPSKYEIDLYSPRGDVGWGGKKLTLAVGNEDREFEKGLLVFSRTELVYRVPDGFKRFLATVGIGQNDPPSRPDGNLNLIVTGDGDVLLEQHIARGDEPLSIDLDLAGVRRLTVIVDHGTGKPMCDHVNLCNARITK